MLKIITIIGARPQFIKAAAVSRAIRTHFSSKIKETIVHTGQHYDRNMSQVFIEELGIPEPNYDLRIGSASHGKQTGRMIERIEEVLLEERPDFVVLYGDTNSTLAGSIAASKVQVPIVHIEAGLRSNNKSMPEEINRILCDHTATLMFTPTAKGFSNLVHEGFNPVNRAPFSADNPGIFHCGDVMLDNSIFYKPIAEKSSTIILDQNLVDKSFCLATIHRNNNTDDPVRLSAIFKALNTISKEEQTTIVLPLHPRTAAVIEQNVDKTILNLVDQNPSMKIIPPASYLDMIELESNCDMVITDSGGLQKEAYFFQKPVIILRAETEWTEIVDAGTGKITDANETEIMEAYRYFQRQRTNLQFPSVYGDGHAAEFICQKLLGQ